MYKHRIVDCARSWIGTSFHHQGRIKKSNDDPGGCDCLWLIMGVCKELNIGSGVINKKGTEIPFYQFDTLEYSKIPNGKLLYKTIANITDTLEKIK